MRQTFSITKKQKRKKTMQKRFPYFQEPVIPNPKTAYKPIPTTNSKRYALAPLKRKRNFLCLNTFFGFHSVVEFYEDSIKPRYGPSEYFRCSTAMFPSSSVSTYCALHTYSRCDENNNGSACFYSVQCLFLF